MADLFQPSRIPLYFNYVEHLKISKTYLTILAIFILGSCTEVYYPEEINSTEKIPVIQGMILENDVPTVTLSWAIGYKYQNMEYISGASVYVTDNLDNRADLVEASGGRYTVLSGEFRGIQGRIYTLHVTLPDGSEYASTPVLLPARPNIDSLYAAAGTRTVYSYYQFNEHIIEVQKGLYIMADLSANSDSMIYYRFNTKMVKEMVYTVGIGTTDSYPVYLWETSVVDNIYSVDLTITQNTRQVLREHPVGFLRYYYDASLETPNSTAPYTVGWVLTFSVYSITRDVYNYYNSIAQQLSASDQIFSPIPSQIKSNIYCQSDPDKDVIGIFEASSATTVYKAFGWNSLHVYRFKDLTSFPGQIQNGSMERLPPDFWIYL